MIKYKKQQAGFSILEVLITAAIIGLITGVVALRYGSFNNLILLKNQAYQIALDLREMQSRSLSSVGQSGVFRETYGIYFNLANNDQYILFIDGNSNGLYDSGEALETKTLDNRFELSALCGGSDCGRTALSVVFRRPNFDAIIQNGTLSTAEVKVQSVNNAVNERSVLINAAGQITVE